MAKYKGLTEVDAEVLQAFARCDMVMQAAGDKLHYARQTVRYHLRRIQRITGLNPWRFFELQKLLEVVKKTEEDGCTGERCPMRVGYDVKNCKQHDCRYRTMKRGVDNG